MNNDLITIPPDQVRECNTCGEIRPMYRSRKCHECRKEERRKQYQQAKATASNRCIPVTKFCPQCKRTLASSRFTINNAAKDRLAGYCKECAAENNRKREKKLSRRLVIETPEFQQCHRCGETKSAKEFSSDTSHPSGLSHRCRDCMHSARMHRLKDDPVCYKLRCMLNSAKKRSKDNGIPFNLTLPWLIAQFYHMTECPIFHIELDWRKRGAGAADNSPTLDRIVPSKGYTKGNVRIISYLANAMKRDASPELLYLFCKSELKRLNNLISEDSDRVTGQNQSPPSHPIAADGKIPQNGQFIETPL